MEQIELESEETRSVYFTTEPLYLITAPLLSAVATLIAILNCLLTRIYSDPLQKMVLLINLADFLYCVVGLSFFFTTPHSNVHCMIAFAIYTFGNLSSIIWGAMFGHALYTYIKTRKIDKLASNLTYYLIFTTFLPLLFVLCIALSTNYLVFDNDSKKCVHLQKQGEKDYQSLYVLFIPMCFSFLLNLIYYGIAIKNFRSLVSEENQRRGLILAIYPLILILCFVPCGIGYLCKLFVPTIPEYVTVFLFTITQLQGFFDAIVYGGGVTNICRKFREIICICAKETPPEKLSKDTEIISERRSSVFCSYDGSFNERKESLFQ